MARRDADGHRRAVLDAARDAFAEHGHGGAATRSVATAAGVAEGSVFYHFGTKLGLLEAVARADATRLAASVIADHALSHREMVERTFAAVAADRLVRRVWGEADDRAIAAVRRGWSAAFGTAMQQRLAGLGVPADAARLHAALTVALVAEGLQLGLGGGVERDAVVEATARALDRIVTGLLPNA